MKTRLRDIRLVPVILVAVGALLALKVLGLVTDGGYVFAGMGAAHADAAAGIQSNLVRMAPLNPPKRSWAQEMFSYPDITGTVPKDKPAAKPGEGAAAKQGALDGTPPKECVSGVVLDGKAGASASERALLERLSERRQELDARAKELELREGLLRAAEKRIEGKLQELGEIEGRINNASQKRDENETARLKSLVTMYEGMKPKDAARIFDRLDARVLLEVAAQMNPRRLSDVLAQMSSEAAERLTVELAGRSRQADKSPSHLDLPKIEGRERGG